MKIFLGAQMLGNPWPSSVVTIGNFDGLHLGHQALLHRAQALALGATPQMPAVVYTFDPHPAQVLFPDRHHKYLFSRQDLIEQLTQHKVDGAVFEPFTLAFSQVEPETFVRDYLVKFLHPRHLVVGQDFNFGHHRAGSVEVLRGLGPQFGFTVDVVEPVECKGQVVSSSRIRQAVAAGEMELAETLLGRPFYLRGHVQKGAGRGQKLGIPTANLTPEDVISPRRGVYVTAAELHPGRWWPAVSNLGVAPTFHSHGHLTLETHILDQNVSLLGSDLRVHFLSYLREEKRFAGVTELVSQIHQDMMAARTFWAKRDEMGGHRS